MLKSGVYVCGDLKQILITDRVIILSLVSIIQVFHYYYSNVYVHIEIIYCKVTGFDII